VAFRWGVVWLIPVAAMLTIAALLWLRVDATEELIPEMQAEHVLETAALAVS